MGKADLAEKASGQGIREELHRKERRSGCYLEYMDSEQLAERAYLVVRWARFFRAKAYRNF